MIKCTLFFGLVIMLTVNSCQKKHEELETNWQEELLGFGELRNKGRTAHNDFFYFGNRDIEDVQSEIIRYWPTVKQDTIFFRNLFLIDRFKFYDSLFVKWKGEGEEDISAYTLSKDSLGLVHLEKAYGMHWTPRTLELKMNSKDLDTSLGYWKYNFYDDYYNIRFLKDTAKELSVSCFLKLSKSEKTFYKEPLEYSKTDSLIFNSFINEVVQKRKILKSTSGACLFYGMDFELLYNDSVYQYDQQDWLENLHFLNTYLLSKIDIEKDTLKIDSKTCNYEVSETHKNKIFARKIEGYVFIHNK